MSAKIIAHSISPSGQQIWTVEAEYPRFIHAELLTHRILSKNSSSSRAIPCLTMIKSIWSNTATPCHWGMNQSGMQAKEELYGLRRKLAEFAWHSAAKINCVLSYFLYKIGTHKQIANRITEPFSHIKVLITTTSWDNLFALRDHKDAQPEFQKLAREIKEAVENSQPIKLSQGEWHLPYVDWSYFGTIEEKLKLSASLCAQTSYRKSDDSQRKADMIFGKLVDSDPIHFSPTEHQARPLEGKDDPLVTHIDKYGRLWSGNFCGWGQYRQLIQLDKRLEFMTCKKQ